MKNQGGDLESTIHPLAAKYLRQERMPHMACPGCGIGQVVHSTLIACDELALTPENTVWVQGVGCSSRITYTLWKGDNIDAHHGRISTISASPETATACPSAATIFSMPAAAISM